MKHLLKQAAAVAALGSVLFALQLFAFTENNSVPPGDNVPAPLNIGSSGQSKTGGLILNTGGAANGLIVQNGNVGIGTASPTAKLGVNGHISFEVAQNNVDKGLYWKTGGDAAWGQIAREASSGRLWIDSQTGVALLLNASNTAGNVGIGTTNPGQKLDVAGNVKGTGLCIGNDCRTAWPSVPQGGTSNFGGLYQTDDRNGGCVRGNPLNGGSCSCAAGFTNYQAASFILGRYGNSVELFNGTLWQCVKP